MTAARGALARAPGDGLWPVVCVATAIAAGAAVARGYGVITVALFAAVLYALFFLRNPALALVAYLATRPAVDGFVLVQAGAVTVGQLWGAGLLLVLAAFLFGTSPHASENRSVVPVPIVALLGLYAVFATRGEVSIALQFGLKLALWLLVIVAVERIAQTRSGQELCFRAGYALAVGTTVLIAIMIAANKYGASWYAAEGHGLDHGTEQSPQPLAYLALFSIAFPLIALLQRWRPTLSLALVGALAIEITLSYVRTALVALVPVVVVFIFVGIRRRRPTAMALAAALVLTAFVVQERLATRFSDLSLLGSGDASGAGSNRVAIWTSVWEEATSSIEAVAVGGGAGTSHAVSDDAIGHYVDAHNDYLEFFATGGVLLAAAYAAIFLWAIRSVRRVYRDRRQSSRVRVVTLVAMGVLAAFFVTAMLTSVSFYAALVGFALLIGLIRGMGSTPGQTCFDPPADMSRRRP